MAMKKEQPTSPIFPNTQWHKLKIYREIPGENRILTDNFIPDSIQPRQSFPINRNWKP